MAAYAITTASPKEVKAKAKAFRALYGNFWLKAQGTFIDGEGRTLNTRHYPVEVLRLSPDGSMLVRNYQRIGAPMLNDEKRKVIAVAEATFTFISKMV